jgi:HEAT repeat protein
MRSCSGVLSTSAVAGEIRDLLPGLDDDERITAIDALGRLGAEEAVDGILQYAHDESLPVRKFVVRALGRIGAPGARDGLSELERADPSGYIRSLAGRELSRP